MFEITINNTTYQFNFGIGFVREIDKTMQRPVDGMPDVKENIGLSIKIGQVIGRDVIALVDVLELANKGKEPRVTTQILEDYIDDPNTDIDKLFEDVIDFFRNANATKYITAQMESALAMIEE